MSVEVSSAVEAAIKYWGRRGYTVRYDGTWRDTTLNSWTLTTPKGREVGAFDSDLLLTGEDWDA